MAVSEPVSIFASDRRCSNRLRIESTRQLIERTPDQLLSVGNFGMTSLREVQEKLAEKGLSLLNPHPDGARIAYTVGQYFRIDVWSIEHFLKK